MNTPTPDIAQVEQLLASQGNFCLIDWLLQENHLAYAHYEAWRYGEERFLDAGLALGSQDIDILVEHARAVCESLGLADQPQDYYPWRESEGLALSISPQQDVHRALSRQWLRPQDLPQMDLFMDNSGVIAENQTLEALGARQFERAQQYLARLIEANPQHEKLGEYQDLINYGRHMLANPQVVAVDLAAELRALDAEVRPLARRVLRHMARDYLSCAWRRLSVPLQQRPFDAQRPQLHNSYVQMQIPDWPAVLASLEQEPALFTSAVLLQRLAGCYEALKRESEAQLAWCLLMELDSELCEAAVEAKDSALIWPLWQDFWEINDAGVKEFFPAYLLAAQPGLVHHLDKLPSLTSPSSRAVIEALQARVNGQDEIPARKKMQAISPALLRLYMGAG